MSCYFHALGLYDAFQILQCLVQLVVDYDVLILPDVAHFRARSGKPTADGFQTILSPMPEPHFQHFKRWG